MSDAPHDHGPTGFWRTYVFSTDHKVIGLQYIITAIVMALVAAALAIIFRVQLAWPDLQIIQPETYIAFVTMHGTLMVFFVISMALVSGMGNFLIPLGVGAKDMAYPFLNALSYWTVVPSCLLMLASFFVPGGAAASGWTAYPPLSAIEGYVPGSGWGQTLWLLAMALFIASATMGGLNYVVTILNCRAPGLSMMRLPLTIWTYFISAVLAVLAFPALTAAAIMLLLDRHLGTSFYLPDGMILGGEVLQHSGGTPLLFQHLFWFLGHPEVYVLVLPGIGLMFDVVAAFARRPPFGYRITVYALLVIGVLSMVVWGHHMFTSGMNPYLSEYFSVSTVIITAPFAVLGVNLIAGLWRARIRFTVPMLFALGGLSAIGTGGLGGLFLGTLASDVWFHETMFVVGHFHLMIGTVTLLSLFAGIYYWYPKMFGRPMNERLGQIHFWVTTCGMMVLFVLMHFQGMGGQLRRTYEPRLYQYTEGLGGFAIPISILAFTITAAQFLFIFNFFKNMRGERTAGPNPWDAASLEWSTVSPPPHGNWAEIPTVYRDPYTYGPAIGADGAQDFVLQTDAGPTDAAAGASA
jgi:cytochrome c oxidase subunit 1